MAKVGRGEARRPYARSASVSFFFLSLCALSSGVSQTCEIVRVVVCCAVCRHQRRLVILRLRRIGLGTWQSDGISTRLRTGEPGLELWRTKITKGGRIIWQVSFFILNQLLAGLSR